MDKKIISSFLEESKSGIDMKGDKEYHENGTPTTEAEVKKIAEPNPKSTTASLKQLISEIEEERFCVFLFQCILHCANFPNLSIFRLGPH